MLSSCTNARYTVSVSVSVSVSVLQVTGFGNKDWLQAFFSDHGGKTGLHP